jgi:hypothetical protein
MVMTGRAMLEALIGGENDPAELAALAKTAPEKLREALHGRIMPHHRLLLQLHLQQIDALDVAIGSLDREVDARIEPFRTIVELMLAIPGISNVSARLAAEIGTDMSRFATASHLISWAGLCPKNDESAGKRRSTTMGKSAPWLKTTLVQCAWAAVRKKNSYYHVQFHRLRSRRGAKKAICAVAAAMLTTIYHMLSKGPATTISDTTTLIGAPNPSTPIVLSQGCKTSAMPFRSPPWRHNRDLVSQARLWHGEEVCGTVRASWFLSRICVGPKSSNSR